MKRPFDKPGTSHSQQIELLRQRGMVVSDPAEAEHCLRHVHYYRRAPLLEAPRRRRCRARWCRRPGGGGDPIERAVAEVNASYVSGAITAALGMGRALARLVGGDEGRLAKGDEDPLLRRVSRWADDGERVSLAIRTAQCRRRLTYRQSVDSPPWQWRGRS